MDPLSWKIFPEFCFMKALKMKIDEKSSEVAVQTSASYQFYTRFMKRRGALCQSSGKSFRRNSL
jgi:hypothetical protein